MQIADMEMMTLLAPFNIATLKGYGCCYFVLRHDHAAKSGGDVDLARQIARDAQAAGATVCVVSAEALPPALDATDLLFLFNIDRPYEAASALARAHPKGRILLYPLHHPVAGVTKYLGRVGGLKGFLGSVARKRPDRYEAIVDAAKALRKLDASRLRVALSRYQVIARLIERCELLVTSEIELAEISASYGAPFHRSWLLPHPVAPYASPGKSAAPRYILVSGRIEPRKNQLSALQGLASMQLRDRGYEVVLAGGKGSDEGYFRSTIDFALEHGIIYVSQLPKSLFFPFVSGATLVVNASFFEVTSLIDLYAIANNIPLVTTTHGYYSPSASLCQVDPQAWGAYPAAEIIEAVDTMLAIADDRTRELE
jgi:glycosyltransferase involved in cell wall biosynthesis